MEQQRDVSLKKLADDILDRMRQDQTPDNAELMIAYRKAGAFRRILADVLAKPPSGEHWADDPSYPLTGAHLRALCEAATWTCKAQPRAAVPIDCNHPFCGCDPHAERIIVELQECGWGPHELKSHG